MLKVAPCTVGHMVVRLYGRKSKFFQPDGLLLPFFIIMGLHFASSAIKTIKIVFPQMFMKYVDENYKFFMAVLAWAIIL